MKEVIAFCLGQTRENVVCGGGMKFVAAMQALKGWEKTVITTRHWLDTHQNDFDMRPILMDDEQQNVLLAYVARTVRSLFVRIRINGPTLVYSPDDYMPDVLRAFIIRTTDGRTRWVAQIFHLYLPPWKRPGSRISALAGYFGQIATHTLMKMKADLVVCDNRLLADDLLRAGFRKERLMLGNCGLDITQIDSAEADGKKFDCVYVGRINRLKGVMDLAGCFSKSPLERYSLRIIGGGEGLDELQKIVAGNGNIRIEGSVLGTKRFSYMKAAKAFAFMSHEEGWGIAIAEALACGVVPVVWDLPVYREVFPTEAVIKVRENDFEAFAKALGGILDDDKLRERLAKEGREFVERYDWGKVLAQESARMEALMLEAEHG